MAETQKSPVTWPRNSWQILTKIIRAWYAAEESGNEVTQRKVAQLANVQPSQVSVNKAFLQVLGIVDEGIALTDAGKRVGLGIYQDNVTIKQQGLRQVVKDSALLQHVYDIIRGRATVTETDFEAEVSLYTRQGKNNEGFKLGVEVIEEILLESGLVELAGNILRPIKGQVQEERKTPLVPLRESGADKLEASNPGLRKIPIPVNATKIWYVEVSEDPDEYEIEKFLDMQKLIFSKRT